MFNWYNNKNLRYLILLVVLLVFLIYKRDIGQDESIKIQIIVPIWLFCIYANYKYIEYLLIMLLPMSFGLSTGYIFPIALMCIWYKKRQVPIQALLFTMLVIVLEFLHYPFYSFDATIVPVIYVNYLSAICIMAAYLKIDRSYDINSLLLSFCIGCAILGVFVVWNTIAEFGISDLLTGAVRIGLFGIKDSESTFDKTMFAVDANVLGMFSITSISVLLILLYNGYKRRLLLFAIIAICFICGALTLSRTFYISLLFCIFFFVKFSKRNKFINYLLIAIIVFGIVFFFYKFPQVFDVLMNRFKGDKSASGRTDIFAMYTRYMFEHFDYLIFGGGCIYYMKAAHMEDATHNGLQQIVACYGLIGLVVFLRPLFMIFRKLFLWTSNNKIYLMPLIVVVFYLQSLQSINPCPQMFPLLPAFWVLLYTRHEELR